MTLYINACVRAESRTDRLARALLDRLGAYTEWKLSEKGFSPLSDALLQKRSSLAAAGNFSDPLFDPAKEFAAADTIVISAPFWDLSFPSSLKVCIENIYAIGIVSAYTPDGKPYGLCRAKKCYYVTTAGGALVPDFGYCYVRDLFRHAFGIPDTVLISAEGLDLLGNDPEAILSSALRRVREMEIL